MSSTYFELKDVPIAKAKCKDGPWFKLDISKTRKNKNKQQPTYYIPFTAKNVAGKHIPLALRFQRQVIASSAKIPFGVSDDEARNVLVSFRELTADDFASTDYEESKREGLLHSNKELIDALNIIAEEYLECVERDVLTYKGDKFKLTKNKTVNCFRQTHRDAGDGDVADDDGKIPLEHPIFRIKLGADPETRKIGFSSEKTGHIYQVFDMKKATAESKNATGSTKKTKPVVAKIKTTNGFVDLTVTNVKHFITYMSLTGGMITIDSICISKSGISLMCKFKELHVWRHKPLKVNAIDEDAVNDMAAYGAVNTNDEEEVFDEPDENDGEEDSDSDSDKKAKAKDKSTKGKPTKTPSKKTNAKSMSRALDNDDDGEANIEDEPEEEEPEDEPEDEPEEEVPATKGKPKASKVAEPPKSVAKPAKPSGKKAPEPEPEPEPEVDDEPEADAEPDATDEPEESEEDDATDEPEEPEDESPKSKKPPVKAPAATKQPVLAKGASLKAGARSK